MIYLLVCDQYLFAAMDGHDVVESNFDTSTQLNKLEGLRSSAILNATKVGSLLLAIGVDLLNYYSTLVCRMDTMH